jgi:DNA repair exonuclease SbcCD nuclease subunit
VALGHYHVHREVAPNAFYAGSIDYTSVNTWGERYEADKAHIRENGKGFVEYDLDARRARFHVLPHQRRIINLDPITARGLSAEEVDRVIRTTVERCQGGIDDQIVRLRVDDLPRGVGRELDQRQIRDFKHRALHFHLDVRRPEAAQRTSASGAPRRRLHEMVREHLKSRAVDSSIDRSELIRVGLEYLDRTDDLPSLPLGGE